MLYYVVVTVYVLVCLLLMVTICANLYRLFKKSGWL